MAIVTAVLAVFSEIGEWIVTALNDLMSVFWVVDASGAGSLTFLGVLAVAGLGFSVIFLIMGIIQRFLHFRG